MEEKNVTETKYINKFILEKNKNNNSDIFF